jgi:hypothetical protein
VKTLIVMLAVALGAGGVLGYELIQARADARNEHDIHDRPIQVPADGYISSVTCQACHPSQYGSWRGSYHRTMTQVATPESVVADFNGVQVAQVPGRPIRLERRGRELWAELDQPDWDGTGDAPPRITRQVVMTTGSHHQQIYWYATGHGRLLGQLPAIRLVADDRWIPRRAAVMHPPNLALISESGSWNAVCVSCHTTQGKPELSTPYRTEDVFSQQIETKAMEFGIACESCHGPAAEHVRANRDPLRRYRLHLTARADSTIVQPLRLNVRRSSEVCGQCHSLWEFYSSAAEREANARGLPYRPGDVLTKDRFLVQPSANIDSPMMKTLLEQDPNFVSDIFWSDGMVRATGREYNGLIDSPCYKNATDDARTLSCFSCHSMHTATGDPRPVAAWADDQLKPDARGNGACTSCHAEISGNVAAHTHHRADSSGSSCYNCHMPHTTYGLLKTIRSHQISSPSVQASLKTGRPNACNLCHLDKPHQWTADYLSAWYGTPPPTGMGEDDRTVAASLVSLLKGDAGQRAIIAQAFGWPPAQQASGTNWMAPYVALLLNDSYDAVRYIAYRSLKTLPAYENFAFDFVGPAPERGARQRQALGIWRDARGQQGRRGDATLLFNADGTFIADRIDRLTNQRDNRPVFYRE